MRYIAFDTETYLIAKSGKATTNQVPRLVCMSWHDGVNSGLVGRGEAIELFKEWLVDEKVVLIGLNTSFDMLVMARALYEDGGKTDWAEEFFSLYAAPGPRVRDCIIRDKLERIEKIGTTDGAGYSLSAMAGRHLGVSVSGKSGEDAWRMRYAELEHIPVDRWPDAAVEYAILDAQHTYNIYTAMAGASMAPVPNEDFQVCKDFSLNLTSAWGVMVDPERTQWIYDHYMDQIEEARKVLLDAEIMRDSGSIDTGKVCNLFEMAWRRLGRSPMMTDSGKSVARSSDAMEALKDAGFFDLSGTDEDLVLMQTYARHTTLTKHVSTYLDPLMDAGQYPVSTRYDSLKDAGRTSSSGPNVQNFPARLNRREQQLKAEGHPGPFGPDIRGCIIPRPGKVFIACDYTSAEMYSLAQICANLAGEVTNMGRILKSGRDPHLSLAEIGMGIPYDELFEMYQAGDSDIALSRHLYKAANYSFGGHASPNAFYYVLKNQGIEISDAQAVQIYNAYHRAYPEVKSLFFADIYRRQKGGAYYIEHHGPNGIMRGWRRKRCDKETVAANNMFQGLIADMTAYAGWLLNNACYRDRSSVLYGDRTVLYIHDEFELEVEDKDTEAKRLEMEKIMQYAGKVFLPDFDIPAEAAILPERWSK